MNCEHIFKLAYTETKQGIPITWTYRCTLCDEFETRDTAGEKEFTPVMGKMSRMNDTARTLTIHGKTYKRDMRT